MQHTNENHTLGSDLWTNASAIERWHDIVAKVLTTAGQPLPLRTLYEQIEPHPKTDGRQFWRDRVRATLEGSKVFTRVVPGVWDLSARHSDEDVSKHETLRRERYPRKEDES